MKSLKDTDFSKTPFLAIWEITRACELACKHCRAEAINWRDPIELTTEEGFRLIDDIIDMGTKILVLTGGDPVSRDDIFELISYGSERGLRMATIPAATDRLTHDLVKKLKDSGLSQMALSIDGPDAESHDNFRRIPGSFERTIKGAGYARSVGVPLQINTVISNYNYRLFDELAELVKQLGVVFWEVFFLVPTGRGSVLKQINSVEYERLFEKLYRMSKEVDFIIKIAEAPHYRRYFMQREIRNSMDSHREKANYELPDFLAPSSGPHGSIGLAPKGVNSGNGFVFISHKGDVNPSGFLPVHTGNVREKSLKSIYREHPVFKTLRDPDKLKGKCGACEFRYICGGSRSRAYAMTGDIMAADPKCIYVPESIRKAELIDIYEELYSNLLKR